MLAAQNKNYVLKQNRTLSWVTSKFQLAFFQFVPWDNGSSSLHLSDKFLPGGLAEVVWLFSLDFSKGVSGEHVD